MSSDPQLLKIKEILEKHLGKGNQISAGAIGPQIGINEDATHVQTRGLILQTIEEFNLPVAAGSRGYYLIKEKANDGSELLTGATPYGNVLRLQMCIAKVIYKG